MNDSLADMMQDLEALVEKGYGNSPVTIYCKNCDCSDKYRGATGGSKERGIQITVNEG